MYVNKKEEAFASPQITYPAATTSAPVTHNHTSDSVRRRSCIPSSTPHKTSCDNPSGFPCTKMPDGSLFRDRPLRTGSAAHPHLCSMGIPHFFHNCAFPWVSPPTHIVQSFHSVPQAQQVLQPCTTHWHRGQVHFFILLHLRRLFEPLQIVVFANSFY